MTMGACPVCGASGCIAPRDDEIRWGPVMNLHSAEVLTRAFEQINQQRAADAKRRSDTRSLRFRSATVRTPNSEL